MNAIQINVIGGVMPFTVAKGVDLIKRWQEALTIKGWVEEIWMGAEPVES